MKNQKNLKVIILLLIMFFAVIDTKYEVNASETVVSNDYQEYSQLVDLEEAGLTEDEIEALKYFD